METLVTKAFYLLQEFARFGRLGPLLIAVCRDFGRVTVNWQITFPQRRWFEPVANRGFSEMEVPFGGNTILGHRM